MILAHARHDRQGGPRNRGYVLVVLVVILAYVAVTAAMQVLLLTSVATTSRAYDAHRQGATEMVRLEQAVAETMLEQRQVSVATTSRSIADSLASHVADLAVGGATVRATAVPAFLPPINCFPDLAVLPDPLSTPTPELMTFMTPELELLCGPRIASYPEVRFEFSSERPVLDASRLYRTEVRARLIAVPLTRFPLAAYDLPSEIGSSVAVGEARPTSMPQGLVPSRDTAFVTDMQSGAGVLPYHYRRRAVLSTAYQYVFSQQFIQRCVDYAGPGHFRNLGNVNGTAVLKGMTTAGSFTTWDLADAGAGTYGETTDVRNAVVLFSEVGGNTLRLVDTSPLPDRPPLLILLLGPADPAAGPLAVELSTITRPIVIVGYNVRVSAAPGCAVRGALLLNPTSGFAAGATLTIGHLSYWAGTPGMAQVALATDTMPDAAEAIAPRVVYVATQVARL